MLAANLGFKKSLRPDDRVDRSDQLQPIIERVTRDALARAISAD
jgi:hypothetical protein